MIGTRGSSEFTFRCICISVLLMGLCQGNQWSPRILQQATFLFKTALQVQEGLSESELAPSLCNSRPSLLVLGWVNGPVSPQK